MESSINKSVINESEILKSLIFEDKSKPKIIESESFQNKFEEFTQFKDGNTIIVTDFDYTLTKRFDKQNERLFSCYCVFLKSLRISDNYKHKNRELFYHYNPIEHDESLDPKMKNEEIKTWYKQLLEAIANEKLTKEDFRDIIIEAQNNFFYRDGIIDLFQSVRKFNIPIYILSAGIHEVIEESLKLVLEHYHELKEKNLIKILANRFNYDEENKTMDFAHPHFFTLNKGEVK